MAASFEERHVWGSSTLRKTAKKFLPPFLWTFFPSSVHVPRWLMMMSSACDAISPNITLTNPTHTDTITAIILCFNTITVFRNSGLINKVLGLKLLKDKRTSSSSDTLQKRGWSLKCLTIQSWTSSTSVFVYTKPCTGTPRWTENTLSDWPPHVHSLNV